MRIPLIRTKLAQNEDVYILLYKRQEASSSIPSPVGNLNARIRTPSYTGTREMPTQGAAPSTRPSLGSPMLGVETPSPDVDPPTQSDTPQSPRRAQLPRIASLKERWTITQRRADEARQRPSTEFQTQKSLDISAQIAYSRYTRAVKESRAQ